LIREHNDERARPLFQGAMGGGWRVEGGVEGARGKPRWVGS